MAFEWARPTSFADPMFTVGAINYYAVDHSPSYLWNSASWEISEALLGFLPTVMAGPEAWSANETIRRATEISDGVILNPAILEFQARDGGVSARQGLDDGLSPHAAPQQPAASAGNILEGVALHEIHSLA